ncbi:Hypothetical predicted protein [Mytilus galloprovincialis]|uniref:TROVE domain-containing protein n=1 Tax=Mytilus galloprovincialis TaxID=29158 RepID=A0A8B6FN65_MYTGA|nr:Hypothetical predicted protein [Mytilus galloprovincialis]
MDSTDDYKMQTEDGFASLQPTELVTQDTPISYDQVENSTGGFVYQITDLKRVLRFLCLGTEKGSYYAKENELLRENIHCIDR